MSFVTIHKSGADADALRVDSWWNGEAYAIHFGENGSPSRTLFLQGDDASAVRQRVEAVEAATPDLDTRLVWLRAVEDFT